MRKRTVSRENKVAFMENNELKHRKNIKLKAVGWLFRTAKVPPRANKSKVPRFFKTGTSNGLSLENLMKEITQVLTEKKRICISWWIKTSSIILQYLDHQNPNSRYILNIFPNYFSCLSIICSIDAFKDEVKPVVTERYNFECWDNTMKRTFFTFWNYRDFEANNKQNKFSIKFYSPGLVSWIDTLMKEVRPLIFKKNKSEYRDLSILIAIWGIFGAKGFYCSDQNQGCFLRMPQKKC